MIEQIGIKIIAGLIGSGLIAVLSYFLRFRIKNHFISLMSRITETGIDKIYSGDETAKKDMIKYAKKSKEIRLFSMRAFRLIRDNAALSFLLDENISAKEVKVLLANPKSKATNKRAEEYIKIDSQYTIERYKLDIVFSVKQVGQNIKNSKVSMRTHNETAFIRLLITDDYAFVSFFSEKISGDDSRVFRIHKNSKFYESYYRYFEWVWMNESEKYDEKNFNI